MVGHSKKYQLAVSNDIKLNYNKASILKNSRIVFNIKGNSYRMIVRFN